MNKSNIEKEYKCENCGLTLQQVINETSGLAGCPKNTHKFPVCHQPQEKGEKNPYKCDNCGFPNAMKLLRSTKWEFDTPVPPTDKWEECHDRKCPDNPPFEGKFQDPDLTHCHLVPIDKGNSLEEIRKEFINKYPYGLDETSTYEVSNWWLSKMQSERESIIGEINEKHFCPYNDKPQSCPCKDSIIHLLQERK